jgi:hypothetical protein
VSLINAVLFTLMTERSPVRIPRGVKFFFDVYFLYCGKPTWWTTQCLLLWEYWVIVKSANRTIRCNNVLLLFVLRIDSTKKQLPVLNCFQCRNPRALHSAMLLSLWQQKRNGSNVKGALSLQQAWPVLSLELRKKEFWN